MRLIILTACGSPENLLSYAPVATARLFINNTLDAHEDVYIHWVLPKGNGVRGWKFDEAELQKKLQRDRLSIHHVEMGTSAINGVVLSSMDLFDLFNVMKTTVFYDAVLNYWTIYASVLKKVLRTKFERMTLDVPIFNLPTPVHNDDRDRMTKYNYWGEEEFIGEATAYLTDYSIFLTKDEQKMALQTCRKYLSASMCKRMMDNSIAESIAGVDVEALKEKIKNRKSIAEREDKRVCLFFGGRWVFQKGFDDVVALMDRMIAMRQDVRCVCTTGEAKSDGEIEELQKKHPGVEFYHSQSREKFFDWIAQGDIFLCFATTELLGLAYWEMFYGGQIGVFVDCPFLKEVLPQGYPFISPSPKQMDEKLLTAIKTLQDASMRTHIDRWVTETRVNLEKILDSRTANERIYQWMKQRTEKHMEGQAGGGSLYALAKDACDSFNGKPFTFTEACSQMTKMSDAGRPFGKKGDMINRFYLRQFFLKAGYRDLCNQLEPVFVRK